MDTRSNILNQGAVLFGEKGYYATSITDIVTASNVARGTFYLYFPNKRKLFDELVDSLLLRITSCIQIVDTEKGAPSPKKQLEDNLIRVFVLLSEERHMLSILLKGAVGLDSKTDEKLSSFYNEILFSITNSFAMGQQLKILRQFNTRIAAIAAIGAIKEVLLTLLNNDNGKISKKEIKEHASQILDIFTKGILKEGVSLP
ncbi:MAG: TetR/AcrR family transcriptional regulator [Deltaproteobacteria bacterium]|nr:TetR/AcrR family transcriptional regulator [Deltaproteobacteria bacterium]